MSKEEYYGPCGFRECDDNTPCSRCGWNPKEAERRKRLIRENGLTQVGGTRRLIITRREKK